MEKSPGNNKRYEELAEKWLNGTITPEEAKEYADWYNQDSELPLEVPASFAISREVHQARMLQGIKEMIVPVVPFYRRKWFRVAAAAVIFFSAGSLYWISTRRPVSEQVADINNKKVEAGEILPGGNKAILTLSDGSTVVLDNAANGLLAKQGNTSIVKSENGRLSYNTTLHEKPAVTLFNTISTPRGGQYQVELPDGSKVWLNAASSLKYPITSTGDRRQVELSGEGYFEVSKNKDMPFIVNIAGTNTDIEVLGTSFNVMAYADEPVIKTTLLEGSVKVNHAAAAATLKPGQQWVVTGNQQSGTVVSNANTDEAVAWKNGYFRFDRADIKTIMRQIARWYVVEVEYNNGIRPREFVGRIPRSSDLNDILDILKLGQVNFRVDGRTITVTP